QHRCRNPAGLLLQLPDRLDASRRSRVALGVRRLGAAGRTLPHHAVRHSAQPALARYQGPRGRSTPNPEAELQEIVASIHVESGSRTEPLFVRKYRVPILLAVSLAAFNQLSGINAILYYLNDIFAAAGFSRLSGARQAVIIGAVNLVVTLIAMTLIDKLGRKTLMLIGCVGMTISLGGVAAIFITGQWHAALIFFVAGFIASFAISSGSVIWVYMSEIFPT